MTDNKKYRKYLDIVERVQTVCAKYQRRHNSLCSLGLMVLLFIISMFVLAIMNKRLYYVLITVIFGIISVPTVINIVFHESLLTTFLDKALIKIGLIFFISLVEAAYIKITYARFMGWTLIMVLAIGILSKIMHWPGANEILMLAGSGILINLTTMAIIERNKGLIHYLLFLFVGQRLLLIVMPSNDTLWWIDITVCFIITITGIVYLLKGKRHETGHD